MKKGIAWEFFIWLVLGLLFFGCTALFASKFFNLSTKSQESLTGLGNVISRVDDNGLESTPLYLDQKSVLVGFSKDSSRFENYGYSYASPSSIVISSSVAVFDRSKDCKPMKACICICAGYELNKKNNPFKAKCDEMKCNSLDNIDFLNEKIIKKNQRGNTEILWKGGFIFGREVPVEAIGVSDEKELVKSQLKTNAPSTLYIERYKGITDVCASSPCITDETKQKIDTNIAADSFNMFVQKYDECKLQNKCGIFRIKMQAPYTLFYISSDYRNPAANEKNGFYLMKGRDRIKIGDKELFHEGMLYKDESTEFPAGSVVYGQDFDFVNKDSKIILKISNVFDTNLPS